MNRVLREKIGGTLAFLFPLLLSALTLWRHRSLPSVSMDGVTYLQIARNVLGGKGLGWQALWAAPLHSLLIAAASFATGIRDLAAVAGIVSPLMGLCLVIATWFLARQAFDRRVAVVAASLAAVFPHLITISFSTEGEITYAFFLTLALGLFCRALLRSSFLYAPLAGIVFALAYLSRSEGFLVMFLVLAVAVLPDFPRLFRRTVRLRLSLVVVAFFFLASLPYLLFLHEHYGAWVVSPKASYVMIWMKSRIYHDNDKGEMENEELWGLSPAGKLRWQEPRGVGDLADYLLSHPAKSAAVYLQNLSREIPGRIPNNSGMERFPQVFPVYIALLALLAAFLPWGERSAEKKRVLLAPFLLLFILPVFTDGWWKYLVPYLPLLLVVASGGLCMLPALLARRDPSWGRGWRPCLLVVVVAGLFALRFHWALRSGSAPPPANGEVTLRRNLAGEAKAAGEWAVRRFGRGVNYMAPWSRIVYYLDGYWTPLPVADLDGVVGYGRAHGVQLLVREVSGETLTPANLAAVIPGLTLVDVYRSENFPYGVAFYRFE